jgi:hypothetical protein
MLSNDLRYQDLEDLEESIRSAAPAERPLEGKRVPMKAAANHCAKT